jgi:hypothetical protein
VRFADDERRRLAELGRRTMTSTNKQSGGDRRHDKEVGGRDLAHMIREEARTSIGVTRTVFSVTTPSEPDFALDGSRQDGVPNVINGRQAARRATAHSNRVAAGIQ